MRPAILIVLALLLLRIGTSFVPPVSNGQYIEVQGVVENTNFFSDKFQLTIDKYRATVSDETINTGDWVHLRGVYSNGRIDSAQILDRNESTLPFARAKRSLSDIYLRSLHEPHSALVAGITIGSNQNISKQFKQQLLKTGTYHMIVASGSNVAVLSVLLLPLLYLFLYRQSAIILIIPIIWSYAALTGMDAPIVRATLMLTIIYISQITGRYVRPLYIISLTIAIMLLINPLWIVDIGFYLSLCSTAAILYLEPLIYRLLPFDVSVLIPLKKVLAVSLAAQTGVLPISIIYFGQFNPLSPLINVVVGWVSGPILLIGLAVAILSLASTVLASVLLLTALPFTYWFIAIVKIFS